VSVVLAAERAKLFDFEPFRHGLLILHGGVVFPLTLGAL
jgi:hypothetical protein